MWGRGPTQRKQSLKKKKIITLPAIFCKKQVFFMCIIIYNFPSPLTDVLSQLLVLYSSYFSRKILTRKILIKTYRNIHPNVGI
jgi:hypothetical protein